VIWKRLGEAIERVESVAGVRRGHDPLVVGLVKCLVDHGVVQTSVNPIDEEVGKENEERKLEVVVEREGSFVESVVEFGVAFDFENEARGCQ